VRLESRPANVEGRGEVTIRDTWSRTHCVCAPTDRRRRVSWRRGARHAAGHEHRHDGSLSTVYANAPRDAIARLETLILMAGMDLPLRAIREQIHLGGRPHRADPALATAHAAWSAVTSPRHGGPDGHPAGHLPVRLLRRHRRHGKFLGKPVATGVRPSSPSARGAGHRPLARGLRREPGVLRLNWFATATMLTLGSILLLVAITSSGFLIIRPASVGCRATAVVSSRGRKRPSAATTLATATTRDRPIGKILASVARVWPASSSWPDPGEAVRGRSPDRQRRGRGRRRPAPRRAGHRSRRGSHRPRPRMGSALGSWWSPARGRSPTSSTRRCR